VVQVTLQSNSLPLVLAIDIFDAYGISWLSHVICKHREYSTALASGSLKMT
jgi:hypothetical protein